ncbi:putative sodium-dependent transporter HI_0736 [Saccoglossus kowalevskii]
MGETTPLQNSIQVDDNTDDDDSGPKRGNFKSRFGMVVSCMGCMVGAGNIWRFPRIAANNSGDNGSLQFILAWLLFLFIWSIPMLVIEYASGRYCKCSPVRIFNNLLSSKNIWLGGWIAAVSTAIACYYAVLCAWCFYYLCYCTVNPLPTTEEESLDIFVSFVGETVWALLPQAIAIILAGLAVMWGVKTIERVNSVIVPIFLLLLLFTFIWAMTLPGAELGLKFLFSPDWELLADPQLWIDAASQNAFDTGAGWGLMTSYAAFTTEKTGIIKMSVIIPSFNNLISLMSAMMTFATVFAVESEAGLNKTEIVDILQNSGPANTGLTFIWMPILYSTITGGKILAIAFFLALSLALLSTEIAMIELAVKTLEDLGVKRFIAVPSTCVLIYVLGIGSAVNINYLVNQDLVWSYALLLSGIAFIYLVWRYGSSKFRSILINDFSTNDWHLPKLWEWIIKFLAPIEVAALLVWFALDQIHNNPDWYRVTSDGLLSCVVQWTLVAVLVIIFNVIYIKKKGPMTATAPSYDKLANNITSLNKLKQR